MLLRLGEIANMAASLHADYQKALAENRKLNDSLCEVQSEIAEIRALMDAELEKADAACETYQDVEKELGKIMALFEA
ncbi:hypothetical protein V6N13_103875 [Hibiscus sabdariffa]